MTLTFEPIEHVGWEPADTSWSTWVEQLDRRPVLLTCWSGPEVHGFESPVRVGGVFVEPLESVVSLRSFSDSLEGTLRLSGVDRPVPYTFYDLEKVARMLLHDSGTALEILATPAAIDWKSNRLELGRRIVRQGASSGLLHHYAEASWPTVRALREGRSLDRRELLEAARHLSTGVGLVEGRVAFDLRTMVDHHRQGDVLADSLEWQTAPEPGSSAYTRVADVFSDLWERIDGSDGGVLGEEALDYDGLNATVVEERLAAGGAR